jgi:aerobic-type carbon monoxide dehydrogenase small subunit (CoxS/CutS family)
VTEPEETRLVVTGDERTVSAPADTPLLYALRNDLGLTGPQFGCGQESCGACLVLVQGKPVFSCRFPLERAAEREVVTLDGLAEDGELHPVQKAFIEEQAMQCGMCANGMIMRAAALVTRLDPSEELIRREMDAQLCRCGSHPRIVRAVQRAAREIWD